MPDCITYRRLQPSDVPLAVNLHQAAFPPEQVARTIYGAPGIARYLANLISFPEMGADHLLWGAWAGETLAGYAHLRGIDEAWHLNNIVVSPAYQGRGIGSQLWRYWVETWIERGYRRLSLDVDSENQMALDWYRRQGLEVVRTTTTYERVPGERIAPDRGILAEIELVGWEGAEAWHSLYGFSHFQLRCGETTWTVGRLGNSYFRLEGQIPPEIEMALAYVDPQRRLLVLSPVPIQAEGYQQASVSFRMEGSV
ncbi:MAG TPA: GNAT family N-acetyltransferase [Chloroflexia bacterium]